MASKISGINSKIGLYFLLCIIIIIYVITLVGTVSNSPALPDIFFVKIHPAGNDSSSFEVRVGYFGMCAGVEKNLACSPSNGATVDKMVSQFNKTTNVVPLLIGYEPYLSFALKIQTQLLPPFLAVGGVFFLLAIISFFLWQRNMKMWINGDVDEFKEDKHLHSQRNLKISTLTLMWSSLAAAVTSLVAVTLSAAALQFNISNLIAGVSINTSPAFAALHWLVVCFSLLFSSWITAIVCETDKDDDIESRSGQPPKSGQPPRSAQRPPGGPVPPPPPPPPFR